MGFRDLLLYKATVKRATSETVSAAGEVTKNYTTMYSDVPCYVYAVRGGLIRYDFGEVTEAMFRGYFLLTQDLLATDKVVVDGTEYTVLFVSKAHAHHLEADLSVGLKKG